VWVNQPWYPVLLEMSVDHPRLITKEGTKTLIHPTGILHPLLLNGTLKLAAWRISGAVLKKKGLSETATNLISQSRAIGTRRRYGTAWKKFQSWCSQREMDPISCHIKEVLNYLGYLFDGGLGYSAINSHRSAISFFHQPVEGFPVGKHPSVCKLLRGIARERPIIPKYSFMWDIEKY